MTPKFSLKDAPAEVVNVWLIQHSNIAIGSKLLEKANDIIDKYPEYFPWEHKFKSIPEEVHEAFIEECYPTRSNSIDWSKIDSIKKETPRSEYISSKPINKIDIEKIFHKLKEQEERAKRERREERQRVKEIWDKHYKQYGLEYRSHDEF
jgi:hypothetical protein